MLFSCCSCPLFGNTIRGKKSKDLVQIQEYFAWYIEEQDHFNWNIEKQENHCEQLIELSRGSKNCKIVLE